MSSFDDQRRIPRRRMMYVKKIKPRMKEKNLIKKKEVKEEKDNKEG